MWTTYAGNLIYFSSIPFWAASSPRARPTPRPRARRQGGGTFQLHLMSKNSIVWSDNTWYATYKAGWD
jgi:hypothetical protein